MLSNVYPLKPRTCGQCGKSFAPARPMQAICGQRCATAQARAAEKARKDAKKAQRAKDKATRERLATIPELIAAAQKEFNRFIRLRDAGKPCICCGKYASADTLTGGDWDCGHYRSTGSASHLRFNEANAHRQLKQCNRHGAGRAVDYRIGLIERIGLEAVEHLEASNDPRKWTREELRAIRDMYRRKAKELEATA